MTAAFKLDTRSEPRFAVVVLVDDERVRNRLWVCVAPSEVTAMSWAGCWSSGGEEVENARSLHRLLVDLLREMERVGRAGTCGPFLDDHLFFDGWDSWGGGMPEPIGERDVSAVLEFAEACSSIPDLVNRVVTAI